MQTLAKGKNAELTAQAIRELLIAMQGTHHNTFDDATDVRDIADLLRINIWLFPISFVKKIIQA